jgi:hypothetical protein
VLADAARDFASVAGIRGQPTPEHSASTSIEQRAAVHENCGAAAAFADRFGDSRRLLAALAIALALAEAGASVAVNYCYGH